jgi:hypothetical protein
LSSRELVDTGPELAAEGASGSMPARADLLWFPIGNFRFASSGVDAANPLGSDLEFEV